VKAGQCHPARGRPQSRTEEGGLRREEGGTLGRHHESKVTRTVPTESKLTLRNCATEFPPPAQPSLVICLGGVLGHFRNTQKPEISHIPSLQSLPLTDASTRLYSCLNPKFYNHAFQSQTTLGLKSEKNKQENEMRNDVLVTSLWMLALPACLWLKPPEVPGIRALHFLSFHNPKVTP
jgi:hypothetical protein